VKSYYRKDLRAKREDYRHISEEVRDKFKSSDRRTSTPPEKLIRPPREEGMRGGKIRTE